MPLQTSFGALRQFLPSSIGLVESYWMDLAVGFNITASNFDSYGHLHFVSSYNNFGSISSTNVTNSLNIINSPANSLSRLATSNTSSDLQAIGFANNTTFGAKLVNGNISNNSFSFSGSNLVMGNVSISTDGSFLLVGQGNGAYGVVGKVNANTSLAWQQMVRLPPQPVIPAYDFNVIVNDSISDGSNIYSAGQFVGTLTGSGNRGGFVMKQNSAGTLQWVKRIGFYVTKIALNDSNANIVCAGSASAGNSIGFCTKINSSGNSQITTQINNNVYANASTNVQSLNVDSSGNIFIGGQYLKLAGTPNRNDGYVIKLDSSLNHIVTKTISANIGATSQSINVVNLSSQSDIDSLFITGDVYNPASSVFNGLMLKVPYDGSSPGSGTYVLSGITVNYQTSSDVTTSTPGSSTPSTSNIFLQTGNTTFGSGGTSTITAGNISISKLSI